MQDQDPMYEKESRERSFERVPEELKVLPQWVNWRIADDHKVPVNRFTLGNAGVHWSNTWASFPKATETAASRGRICAHRIGVVHVC